MGRFGNAGFFAALPLLWITHRIRLEHDREWMSRSMESQVYMGIAAGYYLLFMSVLVSMVLRHRDPLDLGFATLMVGFALPMLIAMLVADHAACVSRRQETKQTSRR
jgi:formate/nitrite transporter FocA (FNT family)